MALLHMSPFLILIVVWLGGVFAVRIRQQRELQREIDALNEIARANG
jgi:hypothetical protein